MKKYIPTLLLFAFTFPTNAQVALEDDIFIGSEGSDPDGLYEYDGDLYFIARHTADDYELWKYDGINSVQEIDVLPGVSGSFPGGLIEYEGLLYFYADGASWDINELHSYDGSNHAVVSNHSYLSPESGIGFRPRGFTLYEDKLFFRAHADTIGIEVWSYDGYDIQLEVDVNTQLGVGGVINHSSNAHDFIVYNDYLYFSAAPASSTIIPSSMKLLYKYDGTNANLESNVNSIGIVDPRYKIVYDGSLVFWAYDTLNTSRDLWSYNGSDAVQATYGMQMDGEDDKLVEYNGNLYFKGNNGVDGFELWTFNGDTATMVADIWPGPDGSDPRKFAVYCNRLYFQAKDGVHGSELFVYDGVSVSLVSDIYPGLQGSAIGTPITYENKLFFGADDSVNGNELWSYTCPELVGIEGQRSNRNLNVYPNPTNDMVWLDFGATITEATVIVRNSLGMMTLSERLFGVSDYKLQLPETAGIYFIQLTSVDGYVQNLKVVRE